MSYLLIARGEDAPYWQILPNAAEVNLLLKEMDGAQFLTELPSQSVTKFPADSVIVFKGEVVVPKPVQTVTEYQIP